MTWEETAISDGLKMGPFGKAAGFFRDGPEVVGRQESRNIFGLKYRGQRPAMPGDEFRPREVRSMGILSYSHTPEEVQQMQRSYEELRSTMSAMPDGTPQSFRDMRKLLPNVNPLDGTDNCFECSMAVDEIQRGLPAVAGKSSGAYVYPGDIAPTPEAIEQELSQAGGGARGIVTVTTSDGRTHTCNVRNFEGRIFWIDGQEGSMYARFPYPGDFIEYALRRTGGGN